MYKKCSFITEINVFRFPIRYIKFNRIGIGNIKMNKWYYKYTVFNNYLG